MLFPEYTNHDIGHSVKVMRKMEFLVSDFYSLSGLELLLLAQAALFHDIGMTALSDDEKKEVLRSKEYRVLSDHNESEEDALREYIRSTHAERSAAKIRQIEFFTPADAANGAKSYTDELATVCRSHQGDLSGIAQLPEAVFIGHWKVNVKYCAIVLRIADSLDLDSDRTPLQVYRAMRIQDRKKSVLHWKKHLSISGLSHEQNARGETSIIISGKCDDPAVHREYLHEKEKMEKELSFFIRHFGYCDNIYQTKLAGRIDDRVVPEGFETSDLTFSIDYGAVVNLLSGTNLYGERVHGIREILQNSIDACRYYKSVAGANTPYHPEIRVILDQEAQQVTIRDNGSGMDERILKDFF